MFKKLLKKICPKIIFDFCSKRREQQWILKLIEDNIRGENCINDDCFSERFGELKARYDEIRIVPYDMRHIGIMCLIWIFFKHECQKDSNILHVFLPIFHKNLKAAPNHSLFDKISSCGIMISSGNVVFWRYCIRNKYDEIKIDKGYMFEKIKRRNMIFANKRFARDFCVEFTAKEKATAAVFFQKYRITEGAYICFYNRDNAYYIKQLHEDVKETPDLVVRNSNVENFLLMAHNFNKKGVSSIRMGSVVERKIVGEGIVDYASESHSDLLDLYLLGHCKFFVVSSSGIQLIAKLFDIPLVIVNSSVISFGGDLVTPLSPDVDLMIIKKFYNTKEKRYLSIREILRMEAKYPSYQLFYEYDKCGIIFEENTDEEIADVAQEMWDRLNGKSYSEDEEKLQERFREILNEEIMKSSLHYYNARIGTKYLKNNPWLLD